MIKIISSGSRLEAWLEATTFLLQKGPTLNVILDIASPGSDGPAAKAVYDVVDEFYAQEATPKRQVYPIHTVAETIFPGWEYTRRGLKGVFETYAEDEYPHIVSGNQWGTYAHRILRRVTKKGVVNPLELLIGKMQGARRSKAKFRACYELNLSGVECEVPLYDDALEARRIRQLPCLSHISFKLFDEKVHLTAIYRSHDYRYKVIGNLLGLARLQACVAKEVGVGIGGMVVHSTYAWIDPGKGKARIGDLLQRVRKVVDIHSDKMKLEAS